MLLFWQMWLQMRQQIVRMLHAECTRSLSRKLEGHGNREGGPSSPKKNISCGSSSGPQDGQGANFTLLPAGTNEEIEISLVLRDMWSKKEMVTEDVEDWRRRVAKQQSGSESEAAELLRNMLFAICVRRVWDQALEERVPCDTPHESKSQGQGYLDLGPVILYKEDGSTRALCAKCGTEHNGGVSSAGTFKLEQARPRKRGGLQSHPFGDDWVEQVMRRR